MRWIIVGLLIVCSSCRPPQETAPDKNKSAEPAARTATEPAAATETAVPQAPAPQAVAVEPPQTVTETSPPPPPPPPAPAPEAAKPAVETPAAPVVEHRALSAAADFPLVLMPHATITDQSRDKPDEGGAEIISVTFQVAAPAQEVAAFYENVLKQEKMDVQRMEEKKEGADQTLLIGSSSTAQAMLIIERKPGASATEVLATWSSEGHTESSASQQ